ncbi:MAG: DUF1178 family protein [Pacificimonas sp.]|jgi:hypothetical protein|nr:DUF1178 family protein [Pacificimonas sp.]
MIVFDIRCDRAHVFEAWFGSAYDFEGQQARALVECPYCGSTDVARAPAALAIGSGRKEVEPPASAPAVSTSPSTSAPASKSRDASPPAASDDSPPPAEESGPPLDPQKVKAALETMAKAQAEAVAQSDYVGGKFADEARAMHYGEQDHRPIYGETGPEEAKALREEGIPATPLLFPVRPRNDA